jgi:trigger factor
LERSVKISVRNLEPTKVRLTITADQEELDPYLDAARKEIAKQVNIPGFRKGHVPGKIIDQRVGYGSVVSEAVNSGVPELYSKALAEKEIHPMAQPKLDVKEVPETAADDTKLKFTAEVEVRPKFELPAVESLEIEVAKPEVTDEDINTRLEALRQRFGTLVSVDRPATKGDYANIDLDAKIGDESVDSQEGVSYQLGSATMLDGLDEALDGLSAEEETTFEGTLEAGEHEGEKAQVTVKVNSVKSEELPELDDDFAQEASEFDTLDELKADVRKQSEADAEGRQATVARDAFIARLQEGVEIPVPKGVKEEMLAEREKNAQNNPQAPEEDKAAAEEAVEKELRDQIVLDALSEQLKITVSQADVTNFLASIAQQYGMDPSNFINAIVNNGQLGSAVQEVGRSKGLLAGMRAVTFKDSEGNVLDLTKFLGDEAEEEEKESVEAASAAAAVADQLSDNHDEASAE